MSDVPSTAPGEGTEPSSGADAAAADPVLTAAAAETRAAPVSAAEAADLADKYDRMMGLAALFDDTGEEMRRRARLGQEVLRDPSFTESVPLSKATAARVEDELRAATTGSSGLVARSIELDADALVLRATVLTYRWIDELQLAAAKTLGSIAARAIGYLAPEVALGGAVVAAGLIETDALDRDGVAAYLGELAEANPELLEHVTSGGGGLLDGLRMRSVLTAGALADDDGLIAEGGLRAIGVAPMEMGFGAALRDGAGALLDATDDEPSTPDVEAGDAPANLTELMGELGRTQSGVAVRRVGPSRYIAFLAGPDGGRGGRRLHLVGGDASAYARHVIRSITSAVADDPDARLMLVGAGAGGVTAAEVAAAVADDESLAFVVEQVVTAGAPSAHVPRIPDHTRVLSLEDRSDPVALLGSLVNAGVANRVTVVFDGASGDGLDRAVCAAGTDAGAGAGAARDRIGFAVAGGHAADTARHPALRAEIERIGKLGYLAG